MTITTSKKILVAPLNWGLGHATRCIPIINALIQYGYEPIIASDGEALALLRKEFLELKHLELPSYKINYSKNRRHFKLKLLSNTPKILATIQSEKKVIDKIVETETIDGIISDNRFGVRHKALPSVFVTHQLKVLSGNTTWLSTKFHQKIISNFNECWVPDYKGENNLSGELGHCSFNGTKLKYIGPLSRFNKYDTKKNINLLVLLSGPEPQRTLIEEKLIKALQYFNGKTLLIRGKLELKQKVEKAGNIKIYNYMTSEGLEEAINSSEMIISRSGYTSIMDFAKLGKRTFFIPTPGQFEQEYLATLLSNKGISPYSTQEDFNIDKLNEVRNYSGFKSEDFKSDFKSLFSLF